MGAFVEYNINRAEIFKIGTAAILTTTDGFAPLEYVWTKDVNIFTWLFFFLQPQ